MPEAPPRRAHVKIDKLAFFQLARLRDLSPIDCWALMTLVLLADWRDGERRWIGTATEMAAEMRCTSTTARTAVDRLADAGLIEIRQPFKRNGYAVVSLTSYDALVVPERRQPKTPDHLSASLPRGNPKPQVRASDIRETGSIGEVRAENQTAIGSVCVTCGAPADGISGAGGVPYCREHEPML